MSRVFLVVIIMSLLAGALQGQSALEIRAATTTPVPGWQQLASPDRRQVLWVAPTSRLTSADIERAEPGTGPNGQPTVTVVLTDEGARKMAELSAAQISKPIAMLLDGQVIWAPLVRSTIGKEAVLSGGPGGLTPEQIQRLLAVLKR